MANHASHAALPYPIKGARYTMLLPYLDADGDPTDPTTPDTEISKDDGAAADTTEEVASPKNSVGMLTLTSTEMDCSCVSVAAKAASGPKTTLATIYPRVLSSIGTGTLSAGSAGGGTLGTLLAYDVTGCFIRTTGGTGGGSGGNQVRKIATYNTGTGAFTVVPNWETTPSTDTTYEVHLPEGVTLGMLKTLNPATAGRALVVDAAGLADANAVKVGPSGSGTAQTAGDIPARLPAALVSGRMDSSVGAMAANVLTAAATAADFGTEIAAAVWNALTSGMSTAGSIGKKLADWVVGTIDTYTGNTPQTGDSFARLGAPAGASVSADIAAVNAKTTNLPSDPADQSLIIAATDAVMARLGAPAGASVSADIAAIEAQTDDIGAAGAGLTAVPWNPAWDAEVESEAVDALEARGVTTTVTGRIDAAISSRGTGAALDAAGVRTAVGLASANLDTQLQQLPMLLGTVGKSGSTYYVSYTLVKNGAVIASGLSALSVTFYDEDGTDLTFSGSPTASAAGVIYASGTLGTAPTDNRPIVVKIAATHGGVAYSSVLSGVNLA